MTEQESQKPSYRWLRRAGWLLLILTILVASLRLFMLTPLARDWVRTGIVQGASPYVKGQLSIERLEGDLWKAMYFRNVSLQNEKGEQILSVDSLDMEYSIPSLIAGPFQIEQLHLGSPKLTLSSDTAGQWNLTEALIFPESKDTSRSTFYFDLNSFALSGGRATIQPGESADSAYAITDLNISAEAGYSSSGYRLELNRFGFMARIPMLPDTINVKSRATYQKKAFSLDQLVVSTGKTLVSTRGGYRMRDNSFDLQGLLKPLAGQDIQAISNVALRQNLDVRLALEGRLSSFSAGIHMRAPAIDSLSVEAAFEWDSMLALTKLNARIQQFRGDQLTEGHEDLPQLTSLTADFSGNLPVRQWQSGSMEGAIEVRELRYQTYQIDRLSTDLSYRERKGEWNMKVQRKEEQLNLRAEATLPQEGLEDLAWALNLEWKEGRPGYWMGPEAIGGQVNMRGSVKGEGLSPGSSPWAYKLFLNESEIGKQPIRSGQLTGTITGEHIDAQSRLQLATSAISGSFRVTNYDDRPRYQFDLQSDDFNVADIEGLQGNSSHIRFSMRGEGEGITPSTMRLTSQISLDSSRVNDASIRELHGTISVRDTVLNISDAELKSEIATGYFSAKQHLRRFYDQDNQLNLSLEIINLQPLASFAKVERLEAEGRILGDIRPFGDYMQFDGSLNLQNIVYDDLINVDSLAGKLQVRLTRNPYYQLQVEVDQPSVTDVILQDFDLESTGTLDWERAEGTINIDLKSGTGARLQQAGRFLVRTDSAKLLTHRLDLETPGRNLSLQNSFGLYYRDEVFKMDTLRLQGPEAPYLETAIPRIDSLTQQVYLLAHRINLRALQEVVLGRVLLGGYFSGFLNIHKVGNEVDMQSRMRVYRLDYQNLKVDSVNLEASIKDHRFVAETQVTQNQNQVVKGAVELPFRLGDPEEFPDRFFDREVQGYIELSPTRLSSLEGTGELLGLQQTDGIVRARTVLKGTAGMPLITGYASMSDGQWSGVPIDSAIAQMRYRHDEEQLQLSSDIISLKQQALNIDAQIPLIMDMRSWTAQVPWDSDKLNVMAETKKFNLSALNEFVDDRMLRNLKGLLDGRLIVTGSMNQPSLDGSLQLSSGGMLLPAAGVTYGDMNGRLLFQGDEVVLEELTLKNGGSLKATGALEFDGMMPKNMDLKVSAGNFKAADTPEYQFIVNTDARLQGDLNSPRVSGSLTIRRGYFNLPEFGEKSVESVELGKKKKQKLETFSPYDSLDISMNLSVEPAFNISNKKYAEMEVGLEGSVDLVKEKGGDLQIFGTINGRRGYIRTLGKRFAMEEAQLQFAGDPANPQMAMRFLFYPPQPKEDIKIFYIINGTLENPKFSYDSDPPMELENIISYTLFGQPYYALESWKQVVARPEGGGNMATNLLTEAILNRIETLATRKLGVDVVEIENNQGGSGSGTSIKTGWYLNERTFLAVLNTISGSTPSTSFILEYMLRRNLELILTQGSESREGIDLHWQKDY